jgi:hypothetical protein
MNLKRCLDCLRERELEVFPPSKKNRDGRTSYCRDCMSVRHRESRDRRRGGPPSRVVDTRPVEARSAKWCPSCRQDKPLTDFGRNRANSDGLTAYCRPCANAKTLAQRRRQYDGGSREYHLLRRYGITVAQYDQLVADQGGVCALCRQRAPQHVDHDHLSGRVRGVLCSCCNQGLGNFRDDAATLRAAADYVERLSVQRVKEAPGVYRLVPPREPHAAPVADLAPLLVGRRHR